MEGDQVVNSANYKTYEFDGHDVVKLLKLLLTLKRELSFLSPKIKEFYQRAEAFELEQPCKSFSMMKQNDFVIVLYQSRDKLSACLQTGVFGKSTEVKIKLNLAIWSLNALLAKPYHKLRARIPATAAAYADGDGSKDLCSSSSSVELNSTIKKVKQSIPVPVPIRESQEDLASPRPPPSKWLYTFNAPPPLPDIKARAVSPPAPARKKKLMLENPNRLYSKNS